MDCACDPDDNGKVSFWHTQTFLAIITVFSAVNLSFPYWGDTFIGGQQEKVIIVDTTNVLSKIINIEGMTCEACEAIVEKVGAQVNGVINISASTSKKQVLVEYDKTKTDIRTIMQAIGTTGYKTVSFEDEKESSKYGSK